MAKSFLRNVLLAAVGVLGVASAGLAQSAHLETAAIRPATPGDTNWRMEFFHGRMRIENRSVRDLIKAAYGLTADSQVVNAPVWVLNQHFDVNGTFDATATKDIDAGRAEERGKVIEQLLRGLLMERFRLKVHNAQTLMPVYALSVSRRGAMTKPTETKEGPTFYGIVGPSGKLDAHKVSMATLASRLTSMKDADGRLVIDETGMPGDYDWTLRWNPDPLTGTGSESDAPSLFTALEEQLGLRLVSKKSQVSAIVIDEVFQPSEN